jgi:hypothetical protein
MRYAIVLFLSLISLPLGAQDAEKKALDAERRALEAERRALDADRRALEAERRAATGGTAPRTDPCVAATLERQRICAQPTLDPLWESPQCRDAARAMSQACGR